MIVLKWICFILVCFDTLGYVRDRLENSEDEWAYYLGMYLGIAARVYVLCGAATYWVLA